MPKRVRSITEPAWLTRLIARLDLPELLRQRRLGRLDLLAKELPIRRPSK